LKSIFGRGDDKEDKTLDQLEQLKQNISQSRVELSDPTRTSFVIVMIPEAMAVAETERLLQSLYEFEIPTSHIIVNMVFPDIPDCTFCRARKSMQQQYLSQIHDTYDDFTVTQVPLFKYEIRGITSLTKLSTLLATGSLPEGD